MNFSVFFTVLLTSNNQSLHLGLSKVPSERREVYHHEQTAVIVDFNEENQSAIRCEIIEVHEPERVHQLFNNSSNVIVKKVDLNETLLQMKKCDDHDDNIPEVSSFQDIVSILWSDFSNLWNGIVSGTKWCGRGNIAKNYYDLGRLRNLDRCCRAHDLCPVKVKAFTNNFNIQNNDSSISKSHCYCDEAFYNCLKNINSEVSNTIGFAYFDVIGPGCIETEMQSSNVTTKKLVAKKNNYLMKNMWINPLGLSYTR